MTGRIQKPRTRVQKNTRTEVLEDTPTRGEEERAALADEIDDLLDDIDEVLEENAQEFVQAYVQKGGE